MLNLASYKYAPFIRGIQFKHSLFVCVAKERMGKAVNAGRLADTRKTLGEIGLVNRCSRSGTKRFDHAPR